MPSILSIAAGLLGLYFSTFIYRFLRNLINARRSGFPLIVVPWDQNHFVWMVTCVPLRPYLEQWLPKAIWNRLSLTIYGFEYRERNRPFDDYAGGQRSYMHVGMGTPEFNTADPEIAYEILRRPKDFQQHDLTSLFMERFGHNVLTSNGERWARQRRIVASVINERVSKAVFSESIQQADGLVGEVLESKGSGEGAAESNKLFDMMKTITINVLSGATMGTSVPFDGNAQEKPKQGFKTTYIDAVKTIVHSVAGPIILPQWFLSNYPSFLPGYAFLKSLSYAVDEFPTHTRELLQQERERTASSKQGEARGNIMSQLLQASESSSKGEGLTEDEMMGNLFIFTIAGFDTTANTLSFALVLMARYPEWQQWLLEEIDRIIPEDLTSEQLDYSAIYPQATRVMAFMLETLRLYSPLIHLSKQTREPQTLKTSTGEYWLPVNTTVYVNTIALHLNPEVYRNLNLQEGEAPSHDDELRFRPSRWLNPTGSAQQLYQPPKGSFLPWSAGPRVCPGQKMAQVEFTSVMLTLLRRCRLEPGSLDGEDAEQTNARLEARMKDSISILTLQMNDIYDVKDEHGGLPLRLVRRT